jgi:HSP20 family protein
MAKQRSETTTEGKGGLVPWRPFGEMPIYREFELVNFFRQFELSEHVDQEKIAARLNNGVLMLQLPRAEKAKPRQIQVQVEAAKQAA